MVEISSHMLLSNTRSKWHFMSVNRDGGIEPDSSAGLTAELSELEFQRHNIS
jgi:hypothetical protein